MGLDMYLNRFPRIGTLNAEQICTAEQFFDWQEARAKGDCDCSFKEWTGRDLDDVPSEEYLQKLKPFYKKNSLRIFPNQRRSCLLAKGKRHPQLVC